MKNARQEKLLELIKRDVVTTQEELQMSLEKLGFHVTQSTISRDIKELRIVKAQDENGVYRYLVATGGDSKRSVGHYQDLFARSAFHVLYSMNIVIVKCYAGMASGAAVALDNLYSDVILGTLAGDDTVFAVTSSEKDSQVLTEELKKLI